MSGKARTALYMVLLVFGMTGLAYASVPLYRMFCAVTGFGGTTQRADAAPGAVDGQIGVRFDANINGGLPWTFEPAPPIKINPGARTIINYESANLADRPTTGRAVFNVSPTQAGAYFSKIECFCFTEQTLKAGEKVKMPVVFFVDPKIRTDPATRNIDEITLSYTFYPVESPARTR
jgi:cytochrome c oxidase assembly protein subunit 11